VERLDTSETVEEPTRIVGVREARDVGAPAMLYSFAPPPQKKKKKKKKTMTTTT
jgi:hypothetical protein